MRKSIETRIGRRLQSGETLVGSSPRAARRRGIQMHGRTDDVTESEVRFSDGSRLQPRAVIWATGFAFDHSWIDVPIFDDGGRLMHQRGVTVAPGLYFLGLTWQYTRGSALLGWVKDDAEYIAGEIGRLGNTAPATPLEGASTAANESAR
jgi:putative flavoprotein involved in K+ transport